MGGIVRFCLKEAGVQRTKSYVLIDQECQLPID